ncbi:MAG TPA: hypothetical protein VJB06_01700, partial [archaeon]|nr:hypothetical protein [archaeon]
MKVLPLVFAGRFLKLIPNLTVTDEFRFAPFLAEYSTLKASDFGLAFLGAYVSPQLLSVIVVP